MKRQPALPRLWLISDARNDARLEGALQKTMQDAGVRKKLEELEVQTLFMGSRDTQKWLEDEVRKFTTIIRDAGLTTK